MLLCEDEGMFLTPSKTSHVEHDSVKDSLGSELQNPSFNLQGLRENILVLERLFLNGHLHLAGLCH